MEVIFSSLRLARLRKGLSMDRVFFQTGGIVTPPRLSRIERGLAKATSAERDALVSALGVPAEEIDSVTQLASKELAVAV